MDWVDSAVLACMRSIGKAFLEGMALYGATMYGCIADLPPSQEPAAGPENGGSTADQLANPEKKSDASSRPRPRLVTSVENKN
jgi:hypothetical protein